AMGTMLDLHYLYRFRSDRSWPAFSRCSADDVLGDGTAASGDSLGTLNGYMEWEPLLTETASQWSVILSTRAITTQWGVRPAPESLTVDVTPRRAQQFFPKPGTVVQWQSQRISDGAIVQRDSVVVDALGLVTVPAVRVQHAGTRLLISSQGGIADVPPH